MHFVKPLLKNFQEKFSKEPLMESGHVDFSAKITPTDEKNATGQKMERKFLKLIFPCIYAVSETLFMGAAVGMLM